MEKGFKLFDLGKEIKPNKHYFTSKQLWGEFTKEIRERYTLEKIDGSKLDPNRVSKDICKYGVDNKGWTHHDIFKYKEIN